MPVLMKKKKFLKTIAGYMVQSGLVLVINSIKNILTVY